MTVLLFGKTEGVSVNASDASDASNRSVVWPRTLVLCSIGLIMMNLALTIVNVRQRDRFQLVREPAVEAQLPHDKHIITWSVDLGDWTYGQPYLHGDDASMAIMRLAQILSDERGWRRAGAQFAYLQEPRGGNIVFRPLDRAALNKRCQDPSTCMGQAIGGKKLCVVQFLNDYLDGKDQQQFVQAINHEVGHCFGFGHTLGGLMDPYLSNNDDETNNTMYPSESEVQALAARLG
jgi:hypothetical protein